MTATETKVEIFMPLYVGDYDRDTADLSFEEHGFYLAILRAMWTRGGCLKHAASSASSSSQAEDKQKLARILRTDVETFERIWPSVEKFFVLKADGVFYQKRLSHELAKAKKNREFAVERARKGGNTKAANAASRSASSTPQVGSQAVPQAVLDGYSSPSPSPSGSSLSLLSPGSLPPDQTRSNSSADGPAFLPPPIRHRTARIGTLTPAFLDVFERYPRRDKRMESSQVFAELADTFPGGEVGLASAIGAAFARGMLNHHPYRGPNDTRPCFDRFLAERRWEDPVSAPDDIEPPKPPAWKAADKAAEQQRGTDRAARRIAQENLDRLIAGEKAVG